MARQLSIQGGSKKFQINLTLLIISTIVYLGAFLAKWNNCLATFISANSILLQALLTIFYVISLFSKNRKLIIWSNVIHGVGTLAFYL